MNIIPVHICKNTNINVDTSMNIHTNTNNINANIGIHTDIHFDGNETINKITHLHLNIIFDVKLIYISQ